MHGRIGGLLRTALVLGTVTFAQIGLAAGQQPGRARPAIDVQQKMPERASPGEAVSVEILVRNLGAAAAEGVTAVMAVPGAFELLDATPTPERMQGSLQWALGVVEPNGQRVVRLRLMAKAGETGKADLQSSVKVTYQTSVRNTAVCVLRGPELALSVSGPDTGSVGEAAALTISLRNTGSTAAHDVVLQTVLPAGLSHPGGNDLETDVGTLAPGETRQITLAITPTQPGDFRNRITATAEGAAAVEHEARLRVQELKIAIFANGPRLLYQDWTGSFEMVLRNDGSETVGKLSIVAELPQGLTVARASDEGIYEPKDHSLRWEITDLKPGVPRTLVWNGVARGTGEQICKVQLSAGARTQKGVAWQTEVAKAAKEGAPVAPSAPIQTPSPGMNAPASGVVPASFKAPADGPVKWHQVGAAPASRPGRVESNARRPEPTSPVPELFTGGWRTDFSK